MSKNPWTEAAMHLRAKLLVKAAIEAHGKGWKHLSRRQQEGAICREIVYSMLGQATISGEVMQALMEDAQAALMIVRDDA